MPTTTPQPVPLPETREEMEKRWLAHLLQVNRQTDDYLVKLAQRRYDERHGNWLNRLISKIAI